MQQPRFWQNSADAPGLLSGLLQPVAGIWRALSNRRLRNGPWRRVSVPVICVGNLNIGGTGKTPTVIALAERLRGFGHDPHVVSRGYGGSLAGPVRVDVYAHKAAAVGDEPLLIAAFCPTWVSRDRHAGALAAIRAGADIILLDDGFQNPGLFKDVSIVVVDAVTGFGNGRVFPAGPLRELPAKGIARAGAVLVIGHERDRQNCVQRWPQLSDRPLSQGRLEPVETGRNWKGAKVLAFAGIGHPEKFFATLRELGAKIIRTEALSDHQPLTRMLLQRLESDAFFKGAQLVTTEKDATRLPEDFKLRVVTLAVRLKLADWSPIDGVLAAAGIRTAPTE